MSEYSASSYRAILTQDERITTIDTASSTLTQAGPLPGVPVAGQTTDLVLSASGAQAAGTNLLLGFTRGGFPGRGVSAAALAWKQTGDTYYRGWEAPALITDWEALDWVTSVTKYRDPHILTYRGAEGIGGTGQDTVFVVYAQNTGGQMRTRWQSRSTAGTWTSDAAVHNETTAGLYSTPCLLQLPAPSPRLLCFLVTYDTGTASTMNVRMMYSDDRGANWSLGSSLCLPSNVSTSTTTSVRLRAAVLNGQILLIWQLKNTALSHDDYLVQYASDDFGVSFTTVETQAGTSDDESAGYHDIVVSDGAFVVGYVPKGDLLPVTKRLGSAYHPLSSTPPVPVFTTVAGAKSADVFTRGDLAMCVDDRGTLWAYKMHRDGADISRGSLARSDTGGRAWDHVGNWYLVDDDSADQVGPANLAACWQRGRALIAHNWNANPGNEDQSLGIAYLGGFTTHCVPGGINGGLNTVQNWEETWLPMEEPTDVGTGAWTATGTASTEDLVTPGVLQIATSSASYYYTTTPTSTTFATGLGVEFGFSRTAGVASVRIILSDGVNDYDVEIYKDGTSAITVADQNAASALATSGTITDSDMHIVRAWLTEGKVSVHYRLASTTEDREWVQICSGTTTTSAAGVASAIRFGTDPSTANHDVKFSRMFWGRAKGRGVAQTQPADLIGCPVGPLPTYIDGGLYLSATDGPAYQGDTWSVPVRYTYAAENLLITEAPSPARTWRSTGTTDEVIAFDLDVDDGTLPESGLIGVYLEGCNAGAVTVGVKSGTYSNYATSYRTSDVTFTRYGNTVVINACASAHGGPFYLEENELAGYDFALSATVIRRIVSHSGGWVPTSSTQPTVARLPRLNLADVNDATDPGSGTGYLYWPRTLTIVSVTTVYEGIRVTLGKGTSRPAPTAGYLTAGAMVIGSLTVLGKPYTAQRVITHRPNVDLWEGIDGTARSRSRGRIRREVALNWEQVDERALFAGDDYVLASDESSVHALAMRNDAHRVILGLQSRQNGPGEPFVYVPRLPHLAAQVTTLRVPKRDAPMLVRAIGDLQVTTDLGNEGESELLGFGVTLREEV